MKGIDAIGNETIVLKSFINERKYYLKLLQFEKEKYKENSELTELEWTYDLE